MQKLFFSLLLLLSALTARAQYGMQVWCNGQCMFFPIASVDSVKFVSLVTDIILSQAEMEMKEGETKQLTASVFPLDADERTVTWTSGSTDIASVDGSGLVTAVSAGTTVITATATDGSDVKAECQVTVSKAGGAELLYCPDNNHPHAIDLGLPSGTKWCCCNVGASTPEGYGGYYAWGETSERSVYDLDTYAYYNGNTGYVNIGPDIAGTRYDAATVNMGAPWRMPSTAQQMELMNNCSRQWITLNGINGILVTGPCGGQIFLPAAGYRWDGVLYRAGGHGFYWSSSLGPDYDSEACYLRFDSAYWFWYSYYRYNGHSVRAVRP